MDKLKLVINKSKLEHHLDVQQSAEDLEKYSKKMDELLKKIILTCSEAGDDGITGIDLIQTLTYATSIYAVLEHKNEYEDKEGNQETKRSTIWTTISFLHHYLNESLEENT